jgi:hypothetical protein
MQPAIACLWGKSKGAVSVIGVMGTSKGMLPTSCGSEGNILLPMFHWLPNTFKISDPYGADSDGYDGRWPSAPPLDRAAQAVFKDR